MVSFLEYLVADAQNPSFVVGTTTLCWNCSHEYDITIPGCPSCGATNGNVDLCKAQKEVSES